MVFLNSYKFLTSPLVSHSFILFKTFLQPEGFVFRLRTCLYFEWFKI